MSKYHKIQTVYERDPQTNLKTLVMGKYATPEFEYLANSEWQWTEKIDGTNIRVMWNGTTSNLAIAGKTDQSQIPAKLMRHLQDTFTVDKLRTFSQRPNAVLHGEGCGKDIQKHGERYFSTQTFVLFDVRIDGLWLERESVEDIAHQLSIPVVPIRKGGTLGEMVAACKVDLPSNYGPFQAEGIVARPMIELLDRQGNRIITKIKRKDFS